MRPPEHLGALAHIEAYALSAILARWLTSSWKRIRNQDNSDIVLALLTSTVRRLLKPRFGVHPLSVAALNVGNSTAIWELEPSHTFGMANTAAKVRFTSTSLQNLFGNSLVHAWDFRIFWCLWNWSTHWLLLLAHRSVIVIRALTHSRRKTDSVVLAWGLALGLAGGTSVNTEFPIIHPSLLQNISRTSTSVAKLNPEGQKTLHRPFWHSDWTLEGNGKAEHFPNAAR